MDVPVWIRYLSFPHLSFPPPWDRQCSGRDFTPCHSSHRPAGSGGEPRGRRRALGIQAVHNPLRNPGQRGTEGHRGAQRGTEGQRGTERGTEGHKGAQRGPAAAPLRAEERSCGPAGRQCHVNHGWGDKGSPNLQLPALTKSLIIFKFGE